MPKDKTLRKIKRMKMNDEMTIPLEGEVVDIICIDNLQYLVFTNDNFYEITYDEILQKYR